MPSRSRFMRISITMMPAMTLSTLLPRAATFCGSRPCWWNRSSSCLKYVRDERCSVDSTSLYFHPPRRPKRIVESHVVLSAVSHPIARNVCSRVSPRPCTTVPNLCASCTIVRYRACIADPPSPDGPMSPPMAMYGYLAAMCNHSSMPAEMCHTGTSLSPTMFVRMCRVA